MQILAHNMAVPAMRNWADRAVINVLLLFWITDFSLAVKTGTLLDTAVTVSAWISHETDGDGRKWVINSSSKNLSSDTQGGSTSQNNWLISPYIPLRGATAVDIRMRINIRLCNATNLVANVVNCRTYLGVGLFPVAMPVTEIVDHLHFFKFEQKVLPLVYDTFTQVKIQNVHIPGDSRTSGMYLTLLDKGTRVIISEMQILYKYCESTLVNLVEFNSSVPSSVPVVGTCVANANPQGSLDRICQEGGNWQPFNGSCSCQSGYKEQSNECVPISNRVTVTVKDADSLTVICSVVGAVSSGRIAYEWMYNGAEVPGLLNQSDAGKVSSIIVDREQLVNKGNFTCNATNLASGLSTTALASWLQEPSPATDKATPTVPEKTTQHPIDSTTEPKKTTGLIVGLTLAGAAVLAAVLFVVFYCHFKRNQKPENTRVLETPEPATLPSNWVMQSNRNSDMVTEL